MNNKEIVAISRIIADINSVNNRSITPLESRIRAKLVEILAKQTNE